MILRNLERRPARALISAVGVGFALAVLLVGLMMLDSIRGMIDLQFRVVQGEDVLVAFNRPVDASALRELERLPGVLIAEPFRMLPVRLSHGHRERRLALTGIRPTGTLRRMADADGATYPLPADGLVLTDRLAAILGVRIGDTIRAELLDRGDEERWLAVAATMDELIGTNAYLALPALNRHAREGATISGAYLKLRRGEEPALHAALAAIPAVGSTASTLAMVQSFEDQMAEGFTIMVSALLLLAGVLAIGVIYNGARIALSERGRELASLRVLGFTRREVAAMLLGEQAVVTFVGLPIGIAIGYGFTALIMQAYTTELYRIPLIVRPATFMYASGAVVALAAIAGLLVRRRLDRADLIAVLKTRE